jgi:DNA repair ATPase RecN
MISALQASVRSSRRELDRLAGEARAVALEGKRAQEEVARAAAEQELYTRSSAVLSSFGEQRQDQARQAIETLVTRGLQVVFGEDLSFHLEAGEERKTPVVRFLVRTTLPSGETVDTGVMDARGGGLAATVGFLLRLVVMLLKNRTGEQLLVLDETFAHVSEEYLPRLSEFLRVDKTGVQIILVTHQPLFTENADKVYRFSLDSAGVTRAASV